MKNLIKKFIPSFLLSGYHFFLAFLGAILYCFPSKKIKVIGIAGTDGKSTVVHLSTKILEEAGYKVASFSSIRFKIGDKEWPNTLKMTTPGRLKLQGFLRRAVNNRCQYAVLEVTDEGIKQHRHRFIDFQAAVLTNITPEHIEAHGSFEKMRQANEKLFQITKGAHIINLNDESVEFFLRFTSAEKIGYQISGERDFGNFSNFQKIIAQNPQASDRGLKFFINNIDFNLKLLGRFNIYNSLAAIGVGLSQGIDLGTCKLALEKTEGVPGRMEVIYREPFSVIVDYAHTVAALRKVYSTLSENSKFQIPDSKMICVLGTCGGGRDKWKRPILGEIAAKYCHRVIITNEDPYEEDPMEIIEEVAKGAKNKAKKILDRREAIREALKSAEPGDMVIITGKGSEPWMCVAGGKKIPWDDRKVVREEFAKLNQ